MINPYYVRPKVLEVAYTKNLDSQPLNQKNSNLIISPNHLENVIKLVNNNLKQMPTIYAGLLSQ